MRSIPIGATIIVEAMSKLKNETDPQKAATVIDHEAKKVRDAWLKKLETP